MTVLRPLEFQNLPSREAMDAIFCICFANVFLTIGIILYQALDFGLSTGLRLKSVLYPLLPWSSYKRYCDLKREREREENKTILSLKWEERI